MHSDIVANIDELITKINNEKNEFFLEGILTKAIGLTLEGEGFQAPLGSLCTIKSKLGKDISAIITGFKGSKFYLMPITKAKKLELGSKIITQAKPISIPISNRLIGRIVDGMGMPLDGRAMDYFEERKEIIAEPINPLLRGIIKQPIDVGIKAINGLNTIGLGQRIGLFAGSGVGKSVLLGMISRFCVADVIVVALIGERGREVKEFIEYNLGREGLQRSVVVASPADYSAVQRYNGALTAMSVAEYFRDQGKHVLLLMDSLTRFAQAQREIALAMGEPPATKGYPPSVFGTLPQLVERAGMGINNVGSITGIFTVLAEGDDQNDPIVDACRAILDGHIVLSRHLAEIGHYPAIDIANSISRVMANIVNQDNINLSKTIKRLYAIYEENKELISIGGFTEGINKELDFAVSHIDKIMMFLQQNINDNISIEQTFTEINMLLQDEST